MTAVAPVADAWTDALLAARLLAADPGLGGAVIRAPFGPARDAWLAAYHRALSPEDSARLRRLPPGVDDDRLLGGLDLGATLAAGRPVHARGLLAEAGIVVVPMAERIDAALAGKLAAAVGAGTVLILLDEGVDDEGVPAALAERMGLWLALPPTPPTATAGAVGSALPAAPPAALPDALPDALLEALCTTAFALGVASARASLFAVRAAQGHAALAGRDTVAEADVAAAARLVLGPRATRLPPTDGGADTAPGDVETPPPEPRQDDDGTSADDDRDDDEASRDDPASLTDRVVAATQATLPTDLLAALAAGRAPPGRGAGGGAVRKSLLRGRPLPSRAGSLRSGQRLALVDTLRAAAPWQGLRRAAGATRVEVRSGDFRLRRFAARAEATTIVAVDASGSAAIARLGEAKGAVELLLAEAYVRRTQVALVAFRGTQAEVVLPPTRSLARAKRTLADLAGGGGTPLAAGLDAATALARDAKLRGRTPFVVVLTDGRANIARDGTASRVRALADATTAARGLAADRVAAAFIDTSARPRPEGAALAAAMGARYVALPVAGAAATAGVIRALGPA